MSQARRAASLLLSTNFLFFGRKIISKSATMCLLFSGYKNNQRQNFVSFRVFRGYQKFKLGQGEKLPSLSGIRRILPLRHLAYADRLRPLRRPAASSMRRRTHRGCHGSRQEQLNGDLVEKVLIFAPDGSVSTSGKFPEYLAAVEAIAPLRIPIRVVMPSVTPVCFASMFSGALPESTAFANTRSRC